MKHLSLVSTVVVPNFDNLDIHVRRIDDVETLTRLLKDVNRNYCGHEPTVKYLRSLCPDLPDAEKMFWDGEGYALAIRPKGGVRGSKDVEVSFDTLEACVYWYEKIDDDR